ncbi:MAG: Cytochrome peroxidase [Labilithrix sp.]|nr:Cytochrome peroxidase [Labilithrix sp.]
MTNRTALSTFAVLAALLGACSQDADPSHAKGTPPAAASAPAAAPASAAASADINPRQLRRFQPVASPYQETPPDEVTTARISLGRHLYYETRISLDRDLSCNSCHDLQAYGVDGRPTSAGTKGEHGQRNSPTVLNAATFFAQFWDGRAANVEEQAKGPILNHSEMAMPDAAAVEARLRAIPAYGEAFKKAFPGEERPVTYENVGRAIGTFERGLMTPGRWDHYLKGDKDALTAAEKEGLKVFLNVGCMVCHTGATLGGSMFERAGAVEPWPNQEDKGRARITHAPGDEMMFKVPTLRNVEKTAPYFHDGSATSLEEAVRLMGKHQLGLELGADEISSIVVWLKSLTSAPSAAYTQKPEPF